MGGRYGEREEGKEMAGLEIGRVREIEREEMREGERKGERERERDGGSEGEMARGGGRGKERRGEGGSFPTKHVNHEKKMCYMWWGFSFKRED